MPEKKPFDDEQYRIPGTNAFNFSKWSRENLPKPPARYKVGDSVVLITDDEVTRVLEDCDGTPLYELSLGGSGWGETNLYPGKGANYLIFNRDELGDSSLVRVAELEAERDALAAENARLRDALANVANELTELAYCAENDPAFRLAVSDLDTLRDAARALLDGGV